MSMSHGHEHGHDHGHGHEACVWTMDMSMNISMSHREIRSRTTDKPDPESHRNQSQNHRETTAVRSAEKPDPEPQWNQSQIRRETRARTTQKMAFLPPNFVFSQSEAWINHFKESDWLWSARGHAHGFVSTNQKHLYQPIRSMDYRFLGIRLALKKMAFLPPNLSECLFVPESDCLTTVILYWRCISVFIWL